MKASHSAQLPEFPQVALAADFAGQNSLCWKLPSSPLPEEGPVSLPWIRIDRVHPEIRQFAIDQACAQRSLGATGLGFHSVEDRPVARLPQVY